MPAARGSGPPVGSRVVGIVAERGWAEQVAVQSHALAVVPDTVSYEAASVLPIAGLTAWRALELGGLLLGRRVLVTGAAGGVGRLAVQLAALCPAPSSPAWSGGPSAPKASPSSGPTRVVVGIEAASGQFDVVPRVRGRTLAAQGHWTC